MFEPLEDRVLLSAATLGPDMRAFAFTDGDGDHVLVRFLGPGSAQITLDNDAADGADVDAIALTGTTQRSTLLVYVTPPRGAAAGDGKSTVGSITGNGSLATLYMPRTVVDGAGVDLGGSLNLLIASGLSGGADVTLGAAGRAPLRVLLQDVNNAADNGSTITTPGDVALLLVRGDTAHLAVDAGGDLNAALLLGDADDVAIDAGGRVNVVRVLGDATDLTVTGGDDVNVVLALGEASNVGVDAGDDVNAVLLYHGVDGLALGAGGNVRLVSVLGDASGLRARIGGALTTLLVRGRGRDGATMDDARIDVGETIHYALVGGDLTGDSIIAAHGGVNVFQVRGAMRDSSLLAGAALDGALALADATFDVATMHYVRVDGDVLDSIIAAGGDPGADRLFAEHEVLDGGVIDVVMIGGKVIGVNSPHDNPGVYAARIGRVYVGRRRVGPGPLPPGLATIGRGVIDPLPTMANALTVADIETILERAVRRAEQLGAAATVSVVDREGNILAVVRMTGGLEFVDIEAGGAFGLEGVDDIVKTSLISATKAGTAAFLSTSAGNAFTTRTAGYIIQRHFPPGIEFQPSGPLFGVQLSSLPTSDVNRLPLGLSADPGGLPLYRGGELLGAIGVEVDGIYTVDPTRVGGAPTVEEQIALAGQIGLQPPTSIRADRIFINGIRVDYANAEPPSLASLGAVTSLADRVTAGDLTVLLAPRVSPVSMFALTMLAGGAFPIVGEVPNNAQVDFFDDGMGALAFLDGDEAAPGVGLTAADVETILTQGQALAAGLRAQIRRDSPQIARVNVSVVDQNGNLLGSFRTMDAPVFGYDVSVQKARTAAFYSRADAGAQVRELDDELSAPGRPTSLDTLHTLGLVDDSVDDPFGRHVDAAMAIGVGLDGTVAVADRTGGFLSRPNLPDGIAGHPPGPLSALAPDVFSVFNTGIQTTYILPNLVDYLLDFNAMPEPDALAAFVDGTLFRNEGVVPSDTAPDGSPSAFGGLPGKSLANGMQIFAGSVPLYKDGVLVGGVGVSGDGIEQDDFVAFTAATGYQDFGPGIRRADEIIVAGNIRLPYIKKPRSPFAGV